VYPKTSFGGAHSFLKMEFVFKGAKEASSCLASNSKNRYLEGTRARNIYSHANSTYLLNYIYKNLKYTTGFFGKGESTIESITRLTNKFM